MSSDGWKGWRLAVKIVVLAFIAGVLATGIVLVVRYGG